MNTDPIQTGNEKDRDSVFDPMPDQRGQDLLQALRKVAEVNEEFLTALETEQTQNQPMQDREAL